MEEWGNWRGIKQGGGWIGGRKNGETLRNGKEGVSITEFQLQSSNEARQRNATACWIELRSLTLSCQFQFLLIYELSIRHLIFHHTLLHSTFSFSFFTNGRKRKTKTTKTLSFPSDLLLPTPPFPLHQFNYQQFLSGKSNFPIDSSYLFFFSQ